MSGVEQRLAATVARHAVTGATSGVWDGGQTEGAAVGLADAGSGRLLGPPTVMHIASITKPVVTTAFLLSAPSYVDTPVIELVPDLRTGWRASRRLTPRQLLSHTSGLHRDLATFADTDDPLLEAVRRIVAHKQELRPGRAWRYCNGGFWLAGLAWPASAAAASKMPSPRRSWGRRRWCTAGSSSRRKARWGTLRPSDQGDLHPCAASRRWLVLQRR
jgi:CubicO group peptidase (beta-lactamase class C family)